MIWTLAETLLVCLVCWGIVLPLIARCIVLQTNKWLKRLTYTVPQIQHSPLDTHVISFRSRCKLISDTYGPTALHPDIYLQQLAVKGWGAQSSAQTDPRLCLMQ